MSKERFAKVHEYLDEVKGQEEEDIKQRLNSYDLKMRKHSILLEMSQER